MKALVIVPTYNERDNAPALIRTIRSLHPQRDIDILVVDSHSPDGTAERVEDLRRDDAKLFLLRQPKKLGLRKAYADGMAWALERNYDCLVTMDADLSHNPRYLEPALDGIAAVDLVVGSRYMPGGALLNWAWHRRVLSRFASLYARTLSGLPFTDLTSGFQCFRTDLLRRILAYPIITEGYAFLVELKFLAILLGARYREIPIVFTDRTTGHSKISQKVIVESALFVWKLFFDRSRVKAALARARHEAG